MTNNKLHVLCLFVLTICIVLNDIQCSIRKECRKQIFLTNNMISLLNDDQKYELVKNLLREFEYERMSELINLPDNEDLECVDPNAPIYGTIYNNEQTIQLELVKILGSDLTVDLDGTDSLGTAVMKRRHLLNSTFLYILNDRLKDVQMCVNDESMKCVLVGSIKRTLNYPLKNKYQCTDNGNCVITVRDFISAPGQIWHSKTPILEMTYRDQFDTSQTCYRTLFEDPVRQVLIAWDDSRLEEIVESFPSDEE